MTETHYGQSLTKIILYGLQAVLGAFQPFCNKISTGSNERALRT